MDSTSISLFTVIKITHGTCMFGPANGERNYFLYSRYSDVTIKFIFVIYLHKTHFLSIEKDTKQYSTMEQREGYN